MVKITFTTIVEEIFNNFMMDQEDITMMMMDMITESIKKLSQMLMKIMQTSENSL